MKPIVRSMLIVFAAFTLLSGVAILVDRKSHQDEWKLVWSEEFDGDHIDHAVWSKIPRGRSAWCAHMSPHPSLYLIVDGAVVLHAVKNTYLPTDTLPFLTGGIYTKDLKSFGKGRIEIRAKFTSAQGFWPALWLLPSPSVQWPNGGEIDIMEHLNFDQFVHQTVHTSLTVSSGYVDNPPKSDQAEIDANEYNVYAVERYTDSICFFVNDVKTHVYPRVMPEADPRQFPFDNSDFYLLISAQLGGDWVGKINPDDLPASMSVDWVRYYERQ